MEKLYLARSKAGHDKNEVYVVVSEEDKFVYLANGTNRTLAKPKKKNRMHIQPITHLPEEISIEVLAVADGKPLDDVAVKRIIKLYQRHIQEEENCQKQM